MSNVLGMAAGGPVDIRKRNKWVFSRYLPFRKNLHRKQYPLITSDAW